MAQESVLLTNEQMLEIPRTAFLPLRCVTDFSDYENQFGFAVYPPDRQRILKQDSAAKMRNVSVLKQQIEEARKQLEDAGLKLDPWLLPTL